MHTNVLSLPAKYYERLGSSLEEKLFFISRIPSDVTVFADFGCGDGRLLANLAERRHCDFQIGYDINAKALPEADTHSIYTAHLGLFAAAVLRQQRLGRKVCLILSSVVHEVLSQGRNWFKFWNDIRTINPDWIVIRDMACSLEAQIAPAGPEARHLEADPRMANSLLYNADVPGMFSTRAEMLEALLKYRYSENMKQELDETYFPLAAEQWLNLTNVGSGYQIQHFDHHSVPWHRENWKRDFGMDIEDPTHIKIILKKV